MPSRGSATDCARLRRSLVANVTAPGGGGTAPLGGALGVPRHLSAPVPNHRPFQLRRQVAEHGGERVGDDQAGPAGQRHEHEVAAAALDQGCDRARAVRADDQVAFHKTEAGPGGPGVLRSACVSNAHWECPPGLLGAPWLPIDDVRSVAGYGCVGGVFQGAVFGVMTGHSRSGEPTMSTPVRPARSPRTSAGRAGPAGDRAWASARPFGRGRGRPQVRPGFVRRAARARTRAIAPRMAKNIRPTAVEVSTPWSSTTRSTFRCSSSRDNSIRCSSDRPSRSSLVIMNWSRLAHRGAERGSAWPTADTRPRSL